MSKVERTSRRREFRRATRGTPPARRGWERWSLPAFLAGVVLIKLIVVAQLHDHPLLAPDAGLDTESYVQLARRVLSGDVFLGPGLYYLSPLYIYFLAVVLGISDSFLFVRVVQAILGAAAVGCIFAAARVWFGQRAAWIAAVLAALTGVLTFFEILILQSALDTFLTAAGLAALASALAGEPAALGWFSNIRLRFGVAGLIFGLEMLNRPNAGIAVAGVIAGLLAVGRSRDAAVLIAGVCFALAPVVARNAIVSRQFALVSSQGGLNFYIGNNSEATGQYLEVPGVRANIEGQADDTRKVAERAVGHALTDAEVSAYFTGQATRWLREHPHAAVRLFAKKLALTLNARHQWLDFSYPYYAYDTGSMLWVLASGPWLLVPLGVAGLALGAAAGRRQDYYVWASFLPWYVCGVAVFFVAERYRLPILVPLSIGAGAFLAQAPQWTGRRRAAAALVVAAGAVVAVWPFGTPDGRFEERLRLSKVLMNRHDYPAAASELQAALALRPADTNTEFNLGMALVGAGRASEGVEHIRHAVDAGVSIEGARYALANAMLRTGDAAGAVRRLRTYSPSAGESAESCLHVAELAIEAGAPDVADRYLRRALELRPGWEEAERARAQIRFERR